MDLSLRPSSSGSLSTRWSIYAGRYMFGCGTATALVLHDVLALLASVIGLPAAYSTVILASPALVVGTVVWWVVVERRDAFSYLLGGAFGLLTALLTGLLWTVGLVSVWRFEMLAVEMIALLAGFVLGVVAVAGALTGLPLMFARRRLDRRLSVGEETPSSART